MTVPPGRYKIMPKGSDAPAGVVVYDGWLVAGRLRRMNVDPDRNVLFAVDPEYGDWSIDIPGVREQADGLMIVWPPMQSWGTRVHLYVANYRPGKKGRSTDGALCGAAANTHWEKLADTYRDLPQREWTTVTTPTGRWHQPFAEGYEFVTAPWRFCPICVGRAVEHLGLVDPVVTLLAGARP